MVLKSVAQVDITLYFCILSYLVRMCIVGIQMKLFVCWKIWPETAPKMSTRAMYAFAPPNSVVIPPNKSYTKLSESIRGRPAVAVLGSACPSLSRMYQCYSTTTRKWRTGNHALIARLSRFSGKIRTLFRAFQHDAVWGVANFIWDLRCKQWHQNCSVLYLFERRVAPKPNHDMRFCVGQFLDVDARDTITCVETSRHCW